MKQLIISISIQVNLQYGLKEGKTLFVIIDELFRGTNLIDAVDCSTLVIEKLVEWRDSFFIISSHFKEIADNINRLGGIKYNFFEAGIVENNLFFNYQIKEGVSNVRLGKIIMQKKGLLLSLEK